MKTKPTINALDIINDHPILGRLNPLPFDYIFDNCNSATGTTIQTGDTVRFNETADEFMIEVDLPGVKKEDTDIQISNYYMHISAKRDVITQGGKRLETITRSFKLNSEADIDTITAIQENGVLTIKAKRKDIQKNKVRKIHIK